MRSQGGTIVRAQFRVPEPAGPGADSVRCRREEFQTVGLGVGGWFCGEVGPGHGDDEEEGFFGGCDAELGAVSDYGGTDVEEAAGLGFGEPSYT